MHISRLKTYNVINDALILAHCELREDFQPKGQEKFGKIFKLQLSYQNLLKIRSLDGLHSLKVLLLDNNHIESIEEVSCLCNLKWLDLSFNRIRQVENLDGLTNLTDLLLFHNVIESISHNNFRGLNQLTALSLGHNHLRDISKVVQALRPLPALKILTLFGNKFVGDEYKGHALFHLKGLQYLDYSLIDDAARALAEEYKFQSESGTAAEAKDAEGEAQERDSDEIYLRLEAYQLVGYDRALLRENKDLETLLGLPSTFDESTQKLAENVRAMTETIKKFLQVALSAKEAVLGSFTAATNKMLSEHEQESKARIEEYERAKKVAVRDVFEKGHADPPAVFTGMEEHIAQLDQVLVTKQVMLKSLLKKSLSKLENSLKGVFVDIEKSITGETGLRRMEDIFSEFIAKLQEEASIAADNYEKYHENRMLESASDVEALAAENAEGVLWNEHQAALLESKDELRALIANTIKESLEAKQKSTESFIRAEISNEKANLIKSISERHKEITRKAINNILEYVEKEKDFWKGKRKS